MNWMSAISQGYYRIEDGGCNIRDHSAPLIVNCCGVCSFDSPFKNNTPDGRHDYYLMYLLCGQMKIQADHTEQMLNAGQAIVYTPDRPYAYQYTASGRLVYLWVHFTGLEAQAVLEKRGLSLGNIYSLKQTEEIEADFEGIQRLFITRPLYYLEEAASRLDILLTHIGREAQRPGEDHRRDRLQASLNYLNRHYAEPMRLEMLAEMEYLSVSRYAALFRRLMGASPKKYMIDLRLRNAREALMNTDLSISEIARSVGYEDPLYFSRLFRKHLGVSPKAVRRPRAMEG